MLIETTLHVHKSILYKLDTGATISGKSRTSIIKMLIQKIMKDNQRMIKTCSRIKYQERDVRDNWSRINIVFNEYEYEYCQDLRKFFKMSVSYIIAYAVLRYLEELLKTGKGTDNYFYTSYIFIKKTYDRAICWQIYWGIPPQLSVIPIL
jgi:hypothetical protein